MKTTTRRIIGILGLLPWLLPATGQAFNFGFPPGGGNPYQQPAYPPPPQGYNFRPDPGSNARGMPPSAMPATPYGYGAYPSGYGQTRPAVQSRLETLLSSTNPFVQQNVLLTLRIISGGNLRSVDPVLPQNEGVMFHRVKGPTAYSRHGRGGQQEIVNELVYIVTPLRSGAIEIPGLSAHVDGDGGAETVRAGGGLKLNVQPARPEVQPWLPLEQLTLTSNLSAPVEVEPGKPVSLQLKIAAVGATGGQLPSLEPMLRSADFRVYREKTETDGGLSANGAHIMGSRTEHYTLVPQYGGTLRLPSARLAWFNVSSGTVEHTSLPVRTLEAEGKAGGLERFFAEGQSADGSLFPTGYASAFWLPLGSVILLMTGYWVGVWYKGRRPAEDRPSPLAPLTAAARAAFAGTRRRTGRALYRLSPLRLWDRSMARMACRMPTPVRFWFWVRCVDREQDPGVWCKTLQFMSCHQLSISPYAPLPQVAEKVIQFQPRSNPDQVRRLFHDLDGAIYGNRPIDFERWKRDFKREVRPGLTGLRRGRGRHSGGAAAGELPDLNPKAAA